MTHFKNLLTFKIGDQKTCFRKRVSKVNNFENRGIKIAFKPKIYSFNFYLFVYFPTNNKIKRTLN